MDGLRDRTGAGRIPQSELEWIRLATNRRPHASQSETPAYSVLGVVPETAPACRCAGPRGFFLFTTFLHIEPPVRCIHCNGIVPLYRLPRSTTDEHSGLLSWKSDYQACDTLQMNGTVGERFGERQMSDPTSELSQSGRAVCEEIQHLTGRPVYYYLNPANARSHSAEERRKCPTCRGAWRLKKSLHGKVDFKCDRCKLLSSIAWNVRYVIARPERSSRSG